MRILACCDYYHPASPGGAERVVREVYERLGGREDVEIRVLGALPGGFVDLPEGTAQRAVGRTAVAHDPIRGWDLTGLFGAQLMIAPGCARRIRAAISSFRPDVIHVNGLHFHSTIAGVRAGRNAGIPVVATAHLGDVDDMPGRAARAAVYFDRVIAGRAARTSDHVIAVSHSVRDHITELGVDVRNITVVHNGVDHERFDPRNRSSRSGPLRVAFVGRMVGNKGPLDALEAVASARQRGASVSLDMIGDGPQMPQVAKRASAPDLDGVVTVHGKVQDVAAKLGHVDVLLRPSYSEGLPLAVLEAMAAGLAVVCSDVPGNIEAVGAFGDAGVIVPKGDIEAFATALVHLAANEEELARLSKNGIARVAEFDWDRTAQGYLDVWRAVTSTARRDPVTR